MPVSPSKPITNGHNPFSEFSDVWLGIRTRVGMGGRGRGRCSARSRARSSLRSSLHQFNEDLGEVNSNCEARCHESRVQLGRLCSSTYTSRSQKHVHTHNLHCVEPQERPGWPGYFLPFNSRYARPSSSAVLPANHAFNFETSHPWYSTVSLPLLTRS